MERPLHRNALIAFTSALLLLSLSCRREPPPVAQEEARTQPIVLNNQGETLPQKVDPLAQHVSKERGDQVEWQATGNADRYVVFFKREVNGNFEPDRGPFQQDRFEVNKGQRTRSGPVRRDVQPGEYRYGVEIYVNGELVETIDPRVVVED